MLGPRYTLVATVRTLRLRTASRLRRIRPLLTSTPTALTNLRLTGRVENVSKNFFTVIRKGAMRRFRSAYSRRKLYYLRAVKDYQSVAYPPRLAVDLGSYVDGEAYGWARQPYGYFDPAPRPRDIIHTY